MGAERWAETHALEVAILCLLVGSFAIGPFVSEIRAFYSKVPFGVRTARQRRLLLRASELQSILVNPVNLLLEALKSSARAAIRSCLAAIYLTVILRTLSNNEDHSIATLHTHIGVAVFALIMLLIAISLSAMAFLFRLWQLRNPQDQLQRLESRITNYKTHQ
jgi:hypothetical protein